MGKSVIGTDQLNIAFDELCGRIISKLINVIPHLFDQPTVNSKDWITPELLAEIKESNRLARKYKCNPDDINALIYKKFHDRVNGRLKAANH